MESQRWCRICARAPLNEYILWFFLLYSDSQTYWPNSLSFSPVEKLEWVASWSQHVLYRWKFVFILFGSFFFVLTFLRSGLCAWFRRNIFFIFTHLRSIETSLSLLTDFLINQRKKTIMKSQTIKLILLLSLYSLFLLLPINIRENRKQNN